MDIAKAIMGSGVSLEKAEAKLKMAELIEALADAKTQASEIQDVIKEKDRRIAELENALELKAKLVRSGDAYYEVDESGNPTGDPYCSNCWERNHIVIHLHSLIHGYKKCPGCENNYKDHRTPTR